MKNNIAHFSLTKLRWMCVGTRCDYVLVMLTRRFRKMIGHLSFTSLRMRCVVRRRNYVMVTLKGRFRKTIANISYLKTSDIDSGSGVIACGNEEPRVVFSYRAWRKDILLVSRR